MRNTICKLKRLASNWTAVSSLNDVEKEKGSNYYDQLYIESEEARKPFWQSRYYSTWTVIVDRVRRAHVHKKVLEIGCGSGQFAQFFVRECALNYVGIDLSREGISQAEKKLLSNCRFVVANAIESEIVQLGDYDLVVCMEVLEHIHDDLRLVDAICKNARCIFTVPNFDYESHVRFFESSQQVLERYGHFFEQCDVWAIDASHGAGLKYFLLDGVKK